MTFKWKLINKNIWCSKEKLVSPVLAYPLFKNTFILDKDYSIGAVLSQVQFDLEKVITSSNARKRFGPAQSKYFVTRRELLAIVTFTPTLKHYLLGRQFIVRTNHDPLSWLYRFKTNKTSLRDRTYEPIQHWFPALKRHKPWQCRWKYPSEQSKRDCFTVGSSLFDLPSGGCIHCMKIHYECSRFNSIVDDVIPLWRKTKQIMGINLVMSLTQILAVEDNITKQDKETESNNTDGWFWWGGWSPHIPQRLH